MVKSYIKVVIVDSKRKTRARNKRERERERTKAFWRWITNQISGLVRGNCQSQIVEKLRNQIFLLIEYIKLSKEMVLSCV